MKLQEEECLFLLLTGRGNRDNMALKQNFLKSVEKDGWLLTKPLRERASPAESACGGKEPVTTLERV